MAHKRLRPAGAKPRTHKTPAHGEYGARELERKLKDDYGGEWRAFTDEGLGVDYCAGFTRNASGRWVLSGLLLLGDAIAADMLRKVPVAALENSMNIGRGGRDAVDKLPPLKRDANMSPEDFSRLVARHYESWARVVPHPAAAMAADAGVKSPTVHSWIREARLRGYLPPARGRKL